MPYIGNPIYQSAFVTDTFSGNGSTTAFTMSVAPAGTTNVLVAISGVLQDPSTYGVVGTTITFSSAPPTGTGNISCRYLGIPVTGITTTAYRTVTEFTATAGQTTFTPPSYTVGFINVYRNGVLLGSADYTATNGTTVVLANSCTAGDLVTVESFLVSSVLNAIPNSPSSVGTSNIVNSAVTDAKIAGMSASKLSGQVPAANAPSGSVIQVVSANLTTLATTSSTTPISTGLTATITPKFSSSKIFMIASATVGHSAYNLQSFQFARGTTVLNTSTSGTNWGGVYAINSTGINGSNFGFPWAMQWLDSPSTTSPTNYSVYFSTDSNIVSFNGRQAGSSGLATITLMEIAA